MPSDPPEQSPNPGPDPGLAEGVPPPAADRPLWKQIRNDLAAAIIADVLRPRHRMPSVAMLREDYARSHGRCAQSTVQRAVAALEAAGFVAGTRKGSYRRVAEHPPTRLPPEWLDR